MIDPSGADQRPEGADPATPHHATGAVQRDKTRGGQRRESRVIARVSRYTIVGTNQPWESLARTMSALHEEMPGLQAAMMLRDGNDVLAISMWDDSEIMDAMELERG